MKINNVNSQTQSFKANCIIRGIPGKHAALQAIEFAINKGLIESSSEILEMHRIKGTRDFIIIDKKTPLGQRIRDLRKQAEQQAAQLAKTIQDETANSPSEPLIKQNESTRNFVALRRKFEDQIRARQEHERALEQQEERNKRARINLTRHFTNSIIDAINNETDLPVLDFVA